MPTAPHRSASSGDLVTIGSDELTVTVNRVGAELWRVRDARHRDYLWAGDPAVWRWRAPLLFPIIGRLRDGGYRLAGKRYEMPPHGFVRTLRFELVEQARDLLRFKLRETAATLALYPFAFRLTLTYRVDARSLHTTAEIENCSPAPMPASFGFHPAFRWPLPGAAGRDDHHLMFDRPEAGHIRRIDAAGLIVDDREPSPIVDHILPLSDDLFDRGVVIFEDLASTRLTLTEGSSTRVEFAFSGLPQLGLWSLPGAGFVCVEPWRGLSDFAVGGTDFMAKPASLVIPPGASSSFAMSFAIS